MQQVGERIAIGVSLFFACFCAEMQRGGSGFDAPGNAEEAPWTTMKLP